VLVRRCELSCEQWWDAGALPAAGDLEAIPSIVEGARHREFPVVYRRVQPRGEGDGDLVVDSADRFEPFAHVEPAELDAVGRDMRVCRDWLCVNEHASGDEGCVDVAQGVHDALERHASQRPAAERDVETLPSEIQRFSAVDSEANTLALLACQRAARH
jgi:hypothetical protein